MVTVTLVHLYAKEMNIYGDNGNVLVLGERLKRREYEVKVLKVNVGDVVPPQADLIVGGGGQDEGQLKVERDLATKRATLRAMAEDGVPMLMVCGMYQLFGHEFRTHDGRVLKGISVFDLHTRASKTRMIGNVMVESDFGELIGFENHSGQTYLADSQKSLGKVVKGYGNNDQKELEGAVTHNVYGTYLHGPVLPKNPMLADELITMALSRHGVTEGLEPLDDPFVEDARRVAKSRPQ